MARVAFLSSQLAYTGGVAELEVQACDFRALTVAIRERFPGFPEEELDSCTVAIDGEIVNRPLLESLAPDARVVFVPRIAAG